MPIDSPVGPLVTLEEVIHEAKSLGDNLEKDFTTPVLVVVAPSEPWAEQTAIRTTHDLNPPSVQMLPTLVVKIARRSLVTTPEISFGRAPVCEVILPFAAMSKHHGFFRQEPDGTWVVGDVGSKNGTYLNGQRITAISPVKDGSSLRFGDVTAKFLLPKSFCDNLRKRFH